MKRKAVPRKTEKLLYQEVGSRCPMCGEGNVSTLTMHHIVPYVRTQQNNPSALIVLCSNCHAKADRREITEDELFAIKLNLAKHPGRTHGTSVLSELAWKIRDTMCAETSGKGGSSTNYVFSENWFVRRFPREEREAIMGSLLWLQKNDLVSHTPPDSWQLSGPAKHSGSPWENPWVIPAIHVEQQTASQITNIAASGPTTIKIPKGRSRNIVVSPPPDSISEAQLREINERAAKISKESSGKTSVGFIKKRIMQDWSLTKLRNLSQTDYPAVLDYLRKLKWGKRKSQSLPQERIRLVRQTHAKAANIGWTHEQLSDKCKEWYGTSFGNVSIHLLRDVVRRLSEIEEQQI